MTERGKKTVGGETDRDTESYLKERSTQEAYSQGEKNGLKRKEEGKKRKRGSRRK